METLEQIVTRYEYMWTTELERHGLACNRQGEPEFVLEFDEEGNSYLVLIEIDALKPIICQKLLNAGARIVYMDELGLQ